MTSLLLLILLGHIAAIALVAAEATPQHHQQQQQHQQQYLHSGATPTHPPPPPRASSSSIPVSAYHQTTYAAAAAAAEDSRRPAVIAPTAVARHPNHNHHHHHHHHHHHQHHPQQQHTQQPTHPPHPSTQHQNRQPHQTASPTHDVRYAPRQPITPPARQDHRVSNYVPTSAAAHSTAPQRDQMLTTEQQRARQQHHERAMREEQERAQQRRQQDEQRRAADAERRRIHEQHAAAVEKAKSTEAERKRQAEELNRARLLKQQQQQKLAPQPLVQPPPPPPPPPHNQYPRPIAAAAIHDPRNHYSTHHTNRVIAPTSSVGACDIPPDLWCDSQQSAASCGVEKQCTNLRRRGRPVKITLIYEALCPFCQRFIANQLGSVLGQYRGQFELELVPWGNSQLLPVSYSRKDGSFSCNHGQKECDANRLQSCVLDVMQQVQASLPFIVCFEKNVFQHSVDQALNSCTAFIRNKEREIRHCYESERGVQLQRIAAQKTLSARPQPIIEVPYLLINDYSPNTENNDMNVLLFPQMLSKWTKIYNKR